MASSNAIEDCEHSFSSPYSQVGCQHKGTSSMMAEERDYTEPSASLPDLAQRIEPHSERSSSAKFPQSGSGGSRQSDKYWYRPGKDEESELEVVVSETREPITELRLAEQTIAYEIIFEDLPADQIQEFYDVQLQRLKGIRETIVASEAVMEKYQLYYIRHKLRINGVRKDIIDDSIARLRESMDIKAEIEEMGEEKGKEGKVWEGFLAFRRAIKEKKKLQACEKAVARLLVKCEDAGKEALGFQKVVWQAD